MRRTDTRCANAARFAVRAKAAFVVRLCALADYHLCKRSERGLALSVAFPIPFQLVNWSEQRGGKLRESLTSLKDRRRLLEELLSWLTGAEATLRAWLDSASMAELGAPLPPSLRSPEAIEQAIKEHALFEDEVRKRLPEYEDVVRHAKR